MLQLKSDNSSILGVVSLLETNRLIDIARLAFRVAGEYLKKAILICVFLSSIMFSVYASAQSNELGFLVGGIFSPESDSGIGYQGIYGHRLVNLHAASLYLELPIVGVTDRETPEKFPENFSSIFFTPSLKLKFLPGAPIAPFLSIGGGLAHFNANFTTTAPNPSGSGLISVPVKTDRTTGAFQVGAGLDIRTPIPLLGLRVEGREFRTGDPDPGFTLEARHHNVFVGAGVVLRF